jgi:hypothetical protein
MMIMEIILNNINNLYLCTHYGFGDYIICYGLVKELAKKYDNVILFGIPHRSKLHINNIKRLYSSIKNVEITTGDPKLYKNVLYVGWDKFREAVQKDSSVMFQKFYYEQVGVPLNLLWDNFYFERNMDKEKEIYYDRLELKDNEEYIFLHDDPIRNYIINRKYIKPNIKIIHLVELEDISILDTLYLIEKSKEVHMTTTGLVSFVDQMNIKHNNLNLHKYVRSSSYEQPILRLNWNIIEK